MTVATPAVSNETGGSQTMKAHNLQASTGRRASGNQQGQHMRKLSKARHIRIGERGYLHQNQKVRGMAAGVPSQQRGGNTSTDAQIGPALVVSQIRGTR